MRVLVTGHRGYIGAVLTPLLDGAGHDIVGLDTDLYERCDFTPGGGMPEVPTILKDIRDVEVADLLGFDAVIHLAALSNDPLGELRPENTYDINLWGTVRVARAAKAAGVERFLFSSSCSNYGASGDDLIDEAATLNPITHYGASKTRAEAALQGLADDRFCPTFLRSATAYGVSPRIRFDLVLNNLVAWAATTGRIHLKSDGTPWRPIAHIEDIARAFLATLEAPVNSIRNEAFNIGDTTHNYQIRELAEIVAETIPGCELSFAPDAGPDHRNYRVNCDKIRRVMPWFKPLWDPCRGAASLFAAYQAQPLSPTQFEGPRYQRVGHVKQLIAEGILDEALRRRTASTDRTPALAAGPSRSFAANADAACCVSCGAANLLPILDLGPMPRSDGFLDAARAGEREPLVPLRLAFCSDCTLVQLLETRPPEEMFGEDYLYFSSFSEDLLRHSRLNAEELIARRGLGLDSLVIEIASNDGYMLRNFEARGISVLGVDPAPHPAAAAEAAGIATVVDFFGSALAASLRAEGRCPDLLIANNVVAHVADQNDVVAGIATLLPKDGMAVVEFPYVRDLIELRAFDTIYHEHLCYFSVSSAIALFRRHGLVLNDVRRLPIHGGSLRLYLTKGGRPSPAVAAILAEEQALGLTEYTYYRDFALRVGAFRERARKIVGEIKSEGKRIAAYGAAAKGTIMLNFLALNNRVIEYAVDRNPHKHGRLIPGVHVPIEDPRRLSEDRPDYVMILPWNHRNEIIRQQQAYLRSGGRFLVPIPDFEIVSA